MKLSNIVKRFYKIYNHPFKNITDKLALQNYSPLKIEYSAVWKSDDNCQILPLSNFESCFSKEDKVLILGDSRGRQITRAIYSVLNGSDTVYNDRHFVGRSEKFIEYS